MDTIECQLESSNRAQRNRGLDSLAGRFEKCGEPQAEQSQELFDAYWKLIVRAVRDESESAREKALLLFHSAFVKHVCIDAALPHIFNVLVQQFGRY